MLNFFVILPQLNTYNSKCFNNSSVITLFFTSFATHCVLTAVNFSPGECDLLSHGRKIYTSQAGLHERRSELPTMPRLTDFFHSFAG